MLQAVEGSLNALEERQHQILKRKGSSQTINELGLHARHAINAPTHGQANGKNNGRAEDDRPTKWQDITGVSISRPLAGQLVVVRQILVKTKNHLTNSIPEIGENIAPQEELPHSDIKADGPKNNVTDGGGRPGLLLELHGTIHDHEIDAGGIAARGLSDEDLPRTVALHNNHPKGSVSGFSNDGGRSPTSRGNKQL